MVESGTRQHQTVEQGHRDTDFHSAGERLQHPAGGRAMNEKFVPRTSVACGDHERLAIDDEADMAEKACVKNFVNLGAIIYAALRQAFDLGARRGSESGIQLASVLHADERRRSCDRWQEPNWTGEEFSEDLRLDFCESRDGGTQGHGMPCPYTVRFAAPYHSKRRPRRARRGSPGICRNVPSKHPRSSPQTGRRRFFCPAML